MAAKKNQPPESATPVLATRRVRLGDLHADPANVNTHPEQNTRAITNSLIEFGQVEPLVVQKGTGKVIGGNGRLEAMRSMGWTDCDVVEVEANDVRAAALGIALNRTAKTSVFDDEALARTLRSLQSEDFNIEATGYDADEVDALIEQMAGDILPAGADGKEYDESIEDEVEFHECPSCQHRWPK